MARGTTTVLLVFGDLLTGVFSMLFRRTERSPLKQIVDNSARRKFGENLRQLASGRITNDEFEDAYWSMAFELSGRGFEDSAIDEIYEWAWSHYSDNKEYRLSGKDRLSRSERREFARAYLFLQSDQWFQAIVRLGSLKKCWDMPDFPFATRSDFKNACAKPRLFTGIAT